MFVLEFLWLCGLLFGLLEKFFMLLNEFLELEGDNCWKFVSLKNEKWKYLIERYNFNIVVEYV